MQALLNELLKDTTVKLLTPEALETYKGEQLCLFRNKPPSLRISSTINGYAIYSSKYNELLNKMYIWLDKHVPLTDIGELKNFVDVFLVRHKIPPCTTPIPIDPCDVWLFSNFSVPMHSLMLLPSKILQYIDKINALQLNNNDAQRYRYFGASRRLFFMQHSLRSFNQIYSLHRTKQLTDNEEFQLDLLLNFLYVNLIATFDCLAWVLQCEFNFITPFNPKKDKRKINLFHGDEFKKQFITTNLSMFETWQKEVRNMRHAMAHSLPYNMTNVLTAEQMAQQQRLLAEMCQQTVEFGKEQHARNNLAQLVEHGTEEEYFAKQQELHEMYEKFDRANTEKYNEYSNVGLFTGTFSNDITLEVPLQHLGRILFDIHKFCAVIDIVCTFIQQHQKD